jgi:hypothetical protein
MNHKKATSSYVDGDAGWRFLFITVFLAIFFGLSIRTYFNEVRVTSWAKSIVGDKGREAGIQFRSAQLQLSRGLIPLVALEISDFQFNPSSLCRKEPAVRISRLNIPLSWRSLLRGRWAIGTVSSDDVVIDLEALKSPWKESCAQTVEGNLVAKGRRHSGAWKAAVENLSSGSSPHGSEAVPWWNEEQLKTYRGEIGGFDFSRVTVLFEEATKRVYLETLSLDPSEDGRSVHLLSQIIIPSELVFDEKIPPLKIDAFVEPTSALVKVGAALSEGRLEIDGRLKPAPGGLLDADLSAKVENVPLSTMVPLLTKSGVVQGPFRPKFMWMNCGATIKGRFQNLFVDNPLKISNCEIDGNGGRIQLSEAVRRPSGDWEPFELKMKNLDLAQWKETFDWQALPGAFSNYGRFDGEAHFAQLKKFNLDGDVSGAVVKISRKGVAAEQPVNHFGARVRVADGEVKGRIENIELDDGEFDGVIDFDLLASQPPKTKAEAKAEESADFQTFSSGRIRIAAQQFSLSEAVQKTLFGGVWQRFSMEIEGKIAEHRLASVHGVFGLRELLGQDFRVHEANGVIDSTDGARVQLQLNSPDLAIRRTADLYRQVQPIFFAHEFAKANEWQALHDLKLRLVSEREGAISWDLYEGRLVDGGIQLPLHSTGRFENALQNALQNDWQNDWQMSGQFSIDYPNVKKLQWKIALKGERLAKAMVQWRPESKNLLALLADGPVTDQRLGWIDRHPTSEAGSEPASQSVSH